MIKPGYVAAATRGDIRPYFMHYLTRGNGEYS